MVQGANMYDYEIDSKIELTKRNNMVSIMDSLVEKYIKQMDDKSRKVYEIAKENLESSFSIWP